MASPAHQACSHEVLDGANGPVCPSDCGGSCSCGCVAFLKYDVTANALGSEGAVDKGLSGRDQSPGTPDAKSQSHSPLPAA
jgi:hypothetical protein